MTWMAPRKKPLRKSNARKGKRRASARLKTARTQRPPPQSKVDLRQAAHEGIASWLATAPTDASVEILIGELAWAIGDVAVTRGDRARRLAEILFAMTACLHGGRGGSGDKWLDQMAQVAREALRREREWSATRGFRERVRLDVVHRYEFARRLVENCELAMRLIGDGEAETSDAAGIITAGLDDANRRVRVLKIGESELRSKLEHSLAIEPIGTDAEALAKRVYDLAGVTPKQASNDLNSALDMRRHRTGPAKIV